MSEVVDSSLRKITKGAAVFFAGSVVGLGVSFFGKVIVARYLNPSEFGVLSLSLVVLSIFYNFSSLGIPLAMTRQASYYLGKGEIKKCKVIVKLSAVLLLFSSLLMSVILFFLSNLFAKVFNITALTWTVRLLSVVVPFITLRDFVVSVFRVWEKAEIKVIFEDLIPNIIRVSIFVIVIVLGLSFFYIILAYVISAITTGIVALVYASIEFDIFKIIKEKILNFEYIRILLSLSMPLLLQNLLGFIMTQTDIIMIGYFMKAFDVGLYSGAQPVARLMFTVLSSIGFLYLPIVSKLYAEGKLREAGRTYAIITKWLTAAVMPAFLVMVLFPKAVLWVLYGGKYIKAYEVLRILTLGFFFHVALGPNGATLLAFGDVREITIANLSAAVANVVLNYVLIPRLGIVGAALATATSYAIANAVVSVKLYRYGIHPLTKNYIKPVAISFLMALFIYIFARGVLLKWWMLVVAFVLFVAGYFFALLLTRSFDREDIMLLLAIEQKLGLDLKWVKRILKKFM